MKSRLRFGWAVLGICLLVSSLRARAGAKDTPFSQPFSVRIESAPELKNARFLRLLINEDGIVYVLTDRGMARLFDGRLALDKSFRPLTAKRPLDIALSQGQVFYLFDDQLLSNGQAGQFGLHFPAGMFQSAAVNDSNAALLLGKEKLALAKDGQMHLLSLTNGGAKLFAFGADFFVCENRELFKVAGNRLVPFARHEGAPITTLASLGSEVFAGTTNGFLAFDRVSGKITRPLQSRLPCPLITCLVPGEQEVWAGSAIGAFRLTPDGAVKYFASKRWLSDDRVLDLKKDDRGDVYILTETGLNKIEFREMTLAAKAAIYEQKIRQRHIRFGFCSELRLTAPGDISTGEMIDTDNDGTWSNYYMASQAFHYGATGDEAARRHAWETFAALERLESINGLSGFPSRTFERKGFRFSDPERWHDAPNPDWEWKAHTSSDEITAHAFGCAVMYETVAKTPAEKERIAAFFLKIMDHLLRNNYYLIDVDGKPTLWGRWNPEYVNWFPHTIGDRRLNSAEIIGMLQFAFAISGKPIYREKAFELFEKHGYLDNIVSSMALVKDTPGFIHQGENMGNEWNHSDDLLAFISDWTLVRFAFNDELRAKYAAAVRDHWELEKNERCPLWSFVLASTGAREFDAEGALWTLRHFPLEMIDWTISNAHRQDITRLPANFRGQELRELLPPDERRITRWNAHPFALAGGSGGLTELAGDEFLLPYWMGRYLKALD